MTDDKHEVRRINWHEVFSFPQIFRGFRMAIHLSKLALALAAIVTVFIAGWVLDGVWGAAGGRVYTADPDAGREPAIVEHFTKSDADFDQTREAWHKARPIGAAKLMFDQQEQAITLATFQGKLDAAGSTHLANEFRKLVAEHRDTDKLAKLAQKRSDTLAEPEEIHEDGYGEYLGEAEEALDEQIETIEEMLPDAYEEAAEAIEDDDTLDEGDRRAEAERNLRLAAKKARHAIAELHADFAERQRRIRGRGIFESFVAYQEACIRKGIQAVCYGNLFGGLEQYQQQVQARGMPRGMGQAARPLEGVDPRPPDDRPGFFYWVLMGVNGWCWLLTEHVLYAAVFVVVVLLPVWSLLGGAMHRIAALHAARDEKMSLMQGLRFAIGKFWSFFTAPLIPLAIVLLLGVLLALGGLLGNFAGGILMALLFLPALLLGLGIAFLLIGLIAGGGLMYPTVAAEGSDSFDAISRSFSYVFTRPFRAAFYGLVALVYGVITYLFVRLFAFVLLAATHFFVSWGVFASGDGVSPHADKLDVIWSAPTFDNLWGSFNWAAMSGAEPVGAFILGIWVFLVAATVWAYLLSYFVSSMTTVYLLLRQKADATDLDDVYVEEAEEEPLPPMEPEAPAEEEGSQAEAGSAAEDPQQAESPGEASEQDASSEDEPTS